MYWVRYQSASTLGRPISSITLEYTALFDPPRETAASEALTMMTERPPSAAETAVTMPDMPQPTTMTSADFVSAIWSSAMGSGATSNDHLVSAVATWAAPSWAWAATGAMAAHAAPATAVPATKERRVNFESMTSSFSQKDGLRLCASYTACSRHAWTALRKPMDVRVAPPTTSTSRVWPSTTVGMRTSSMAGTPT